MSEAPFISRSGKIYPIEIDIELLYDDAIVPSQALPSDAGYDLHAYNTRVTLAPGQRHLFQTGICVAIPPGHVGYIRPRSGLAHKHGIDVLGGVIDSGYRGEIGVILVNHGQEPVDFAPFDRIAQLVVHPVMEVNFWTVPRLRESHRGAGGFGSTGVGAYPSGPYNPQPNHLTEAEKALGLDGK